MPLTITHNNDKLYNSIKFQNSDTGSYYKYINSQQMPFTKGVVYEITYNLYTQYTSSAPFDLYMTCSNQYNAFEKTNQFGYLVEFVTASLNTYTQKSHLITPLYNGTASLCMILKYGTYYVSDIKVKPYSTNNFSLGEMEVIIPSPQIKRNEPISIYPVYISRNGKPVGDTSVVLSDAGESKEYSRYTLITGSNLVVSQDDNLIEGSLFVGKNLRTGVEISGFNNAMIRSVGYAGFENARNNNWPGFIIYSGSILPGSGDNYRGVGLELHAGGNNGSLRYRVDDSGSFLEVSGNIYATNGYFSGVVSASIGRFGGWTIDSHSFYSDTITMWSTGSQSSGSALEFYDRNNNRTYLAIAIHERPITYYESSQSLNSGFESISVNGEESFTAITKNYTTAFFTLGKTLQQDTGSSLIFDFANSGVSTPGDLIISGAYNVSFDMYSSGTFSITAPLYLNGIEKKGRIRSIWQKNDIMSNASSQANFVSPNEFNMYCTSPNTVWTGMTYVASDSTILSINSNYYGFVSTSYFRGVPAQGGGTLAAAGKVNDIIHSGIAGNNTSIYGAGGLKVGIYGIAAGVTSISNISSSANGIAVLGDALPGTNAKSGVFRFGKFIIGDPFNKFYAGALTESPVPEIVFYVDAQKVSSSKLNPKFGRVGINMSDPSYTLDVVGDIRATGDITAFSDIRKKTNIIQISKSSDIVNNLVGVKYTWKTGNNSPQHGNNFIKNEYKQRIGLIAQDVEKYLPEVVFTDDFGYKSIDYGSITAVLIESVKEQNKEIYKLTTKIDELNNKLLKTDIK